MNGRAIRAVIASGILGALLLGILAGAAGAAGGSRQSASLTFGQTRPGTASGASVGIDYVNPSDPSAKPPAVRRVVLGFAPGTQIDTSAPQVCTAPDAELMLLGGAACPAGSKVGTGVVTVDTGVPGPGRFVTADVDFFNNTHQLIYVNTIRGTGARTVIRASVTSNKVVTDAPLLPGTPPDGGAIDTVAVHFPPLVRGGHAYIRTPRVCPTSRQWPNQLTFTYADGVSQTVSSPSPCNPGSANRAR
jgi:hypothetical protein